VQGVTVAGTTGVTGTGLNQMNTPEGIVIDRSNTLYIADTYNHRILKFLSGASSSTVVAGQALGIPSSSAFGLSYPKGVTVDQNSNVYVADTNNNRIQLWTSGSSIGTTVAGNGM
jgi:sugar lactone lactonase YvrE